MDKRAAATTTAISQNISLFSGFDMIDASVFIGPYFDHFLSCLKLTGAIETSMTWLWLLRILAQNLRLMMLTMQFINDVIDNTVLKLLLSSLLTEIAFVFRNVFFLHNY